MKKEYAREILAETPLEIDDALQILSTRRPQTPCRLDTAFLAVMASARLLAPTHDDLLRERAENRRLAEQALRDQALIKYQTEELEDLRKETGRKE